jgi:bla regulator protein blaR1
VHHVHIDTHSNASHGIALFDGDTVMINGSDLDLASAERLHETSPGSFMWFRRGDQAYLIRDENYIRRARDAQAPVTELARMEGRLAGEEGRLAGQEGGLAAREGALSGRQAELEGRRAALEGERAALAANPTDTSRRATIDSQMQSLEARAKDLAARRTELNGQQHALSQQQAELSRQQSALSAQQRQAEEKANAELDRLLNEALAHGVAHPVSAH